MSDFEVKQETKVAENDEILQMNGLKYKMPQSLSTTLNRTLIKQYSQRQSYSAGDTIVFDINSGSRYISPLDCALKLSVRTSGGTLGDDSKLPDSGSIALINEIRIFAKNGVELERIQDVNQYVHTKTQYEESVESVISYSQMYGGGDSPADVANNADSTFIIPLSKLSGLFDPIVKGMKMPPSLISGARIELVLESFARAFNATGGANTGYIVSNPQILMMASELNDQTQAILNAESAQTGLEYSFKRCFSTTETTNSTSLNIQVKKAVAQGLRAMCVPKLAANVEEKTVDSFNSASATDSSFTNFQWRIGSSFYPQQKTDSQVENLYVTQGAFNKHALRPWNSGALGLTLYNTEKYAVGSGFETDTRLNLSGKPINNSSTLELQATVVPQGAGVKYFVFMEFVAVCRCWLSNVTLKI
jgi:hypothetical protein